jgi:hypothetical protein
VVHRKQKKSCSQEANKLMKANNLMVYSKHNGSQQANSYCSQQANK